MANPNTIKQIVQLFQKLGGNVSDVLGTRSNINFLGKGKSPELMLDMDINTEALSVLPQSKAVEELTSSVGYAVGNKLNDIQANKLLENMQKMDAIYNPAPSPTNITDLATGTRNLNKEGLESLRSKIDLPEGVDPRDTILPSRLADDLPPPGSRGGVDDIAAPVASMDDVIKNIVDIEGGSPSGAGLELLKNVKNNNLIINDVVDKIYLNAGVAPAAQPVVRANAREFLNRVKSLTDDVEGTTLSDVMEADDFKFMTEGGGGGIGDPLLLVQKYFGPKVAAAVAKLDGPNDIQLFAERLISVKDARGRGVTNRNFDPDTVDIDDFEFADGGRVPYFKGKLVGKALGLAKKAAARAGGSKEMGYQALRKYGIEADDISRLFASVGSDPNLVGKEKTAYMRQLHNVLRNPDDFPDAIKDIQIRLGLDPIGFKSGGLAKILEV